MRDRGISGLTRLSLLAAAPLTLLLGLAAVFYAIAIERCFDGCSPGLNIWLLRIGGLANGLILLTAAIYSIAALFGQDVQPRTARRALLLAALGIVGFAVFFFFLAVEGVRQTT